MRKRILRFLAVIMIGALLVGNAGIADTYYTVYANELNAEGTETNGELLTTDEPEGTSDVISLTPGDVNLDDSVNSKDALLVLEHAAKINQLDEDAEIRANVDVSNNVDAKDALYILQYAARIIDSFDDIKVNYGGIPTESEEPTPKPTKEPTGYELFDSINVDCDYSNSFVVEIKSTDNKCFTTSDFSEVALKDVWTRGKTKTEDGYIYQLVMVLDDTNATEETLRSAMEEVKAYDNVISVANNDYFEHDTILDLNYSEYILEVGESVDISIAEYSPYNESAETICLLIKLNEKKINGEDFNLETLTQYGVTSLNEGIYIPTGADIWMDYERNEETDYWVEVYDGVDNEINNITVAHLLSQLPEVDMVQIVRNTIPTGNRHYENWECSDDSIVSMELSGGEEYYTQESAVTRLNQTATITALAPGKATISVTKGGWGNREATGTCVINVVEPNRAVYTAEYPQMVQYVDYDTNEQLYDAWLTGRDEQTDKYSEYKNSLNDFYGKTITEALSDSNGKNVVYSPLNVYMALSMLAETTDGNGRQQILDLIGVDSIDSLRDQANAVWNGNYCDDGTVTSILANSIWLRDDTQYNSNLLKTLSENYYASSFRGEMGSEEYNKLLQNWLNTQTGNMLEEQVKGINTKPEYALMLASSVYYRGKWASEFSTGYTEADVFYTDNGEVSASFMKKHKRVNTYYWADKFSAVAESIEEGGKMWFILPDEGVSVDELLDEAQLMEFINARGNWENSRKMLVNLSVPKFDITSDMDLKGMLNNLGVTDVFSTQTASFTPLLNNSEGVYVSEIKHGGRIAIDEKGCVATSFVVTSFSGSPAPPEEIVDFNLNRPFIFVLTSEVGAPLYVGVVNNPT